MPPFGPTSRRDLVSALRTAGFDGPYVGSKHQVMEGRGTRIRIPNPHHSAIEVELLSRIPHQAGISRDEWERL